MSTYTSRTNVTITATVDGSVSEYQVDSALRRVARDNGVELHSLTVETTPAERSVTVDMTETEHTAFQAWQASRDGNTSA